MLDKHKFANTENAFMNVAPQEFLGLPENRGRNLNRNQTDARARTLCVGIVLRPLTYVSGWIFSRQPPFYSYSPNFHR